MRQKLRKYAPPGFDTNREINLIITGYILSVVYSLGFVFKFLTSYRILFINEYGRYTDIPSGVMPSCSHLLEGVFFGFWVLIGMMAVAVFIHHIYYYVGSKSIYLMKRLPAKKEFAKRNWTIPLLTVAISLLTVFLLIVIYYAIYMIFAPENCILPNQWLRIWRLPI